MTKFVTAGPERYRHQKMALTKMIRTGGVTGLLFDPGCIYGDAEIQVNRNGKGFSLPLRELVRRFNGEQPLDRSGKRNGKPWTDAPTLVQREAEDGTVRLAEIKATWSSGVKMTYTVTTDAGRTIRATDEHPFLTERGWVRLDQLEPGDLVHVRGAQRAAGRQVKQRYRERGGLRFHPHAYKREAKHTPWRVAEHRLVVEADMNQMSLPSWLQVLRSGNPSKPPIFLSPDKAVHHIDTDPTNNALSNLQVMTHEEHHRLHATEGGKTRSVLFKVGVERVESVEPYGEEETFDIEVADDPHNFIADGFVVHNTGKTAPTLDYMSLLALKAEPRSIAGSTEKVQEARVLVVAPLAAVDTWVIQARSYLSPMVDFWAEALGGSLVQRAEALAARGGNGFRGTENYIRGRDKVVRQAPLRALHFSKSLAWDARSTDRDVSKADGPDGVRGKPRVVLEVLNIDTFSSRLAHKSGTMADLMLDAVKRFSPDLVVVDESHKIKGASSNASRLLGRIAEHVQRRIILTGTVMPHSALDVFGQWRFLEPYAFGVRDGRGVDRRATFSGFKEQFAQMGGYMGREVVGFQNLDEMQNIMARNAVVARKEDVLDLPSTTEVTVPVNLSAAEQRAYDEMKSQLATTLTDGSMASTTNRLAQMMRLRQITSGHLPDDNGTTRTLGSSKADTIRSIVQDTLAGEKRIVIFCLFTHEIEALRQKLAARGTEVLTIAGGTSSEERMRLRKRFGVNPDEPGSPEPGRMVLIAQVKTLSLAVNELVTANHAIFGSLSQQRDDLVQARDRLDRIGQARPVTFWMTIAPRTVDEVIMKAHQDRTNLEDAVLAHIMGEG